MELNNTIEIKDIIATASPVIKSLVDTFVTPKLVAFRDKNKKASEQALPSSEDFLEYYHRTYKKLVVVNTLVFNNSQRLLPDIYIPLTISSTHDEKIRSKVNGFPQKVSDEFGNLLITDTAGMGKSTMMKTIFLDCISSNIGIPIFIELRRLNSEKSIVDEIKEQLNSLNKNFDTQLLLNLLADGGFIIILDGYDEISLSQRDVVTSDIQEFISKASNNRFFITSRPEKSLASFGSFQEFRISPLNKKEAFELLRKYDRQGTISSLLIKKIEEKDMSNVQEFLTNPLLVSLLYTAFEHKQAIPFKKYLFYRQVYDANFESHDLTKGDSYTHEKYSKLEIDDFHRVLRHIGYSCFKKQKIEFTKDELLKLIAESKKFCIGLSFKESDFLMDILKTVPLFTQDGNYYRWSHKSLQEYFAAQFIYLDSKIKQNDILLRIFNHPSLEKFINVLDLYYDMDYRSFRNTILYSLLDDFVSYIASCYNDLSDSIGIELIKIRKELTFLNECYFFYAKESKENDPLDGNKLSIMIDKCEKEYSLDESRFSGVLVSPRMTNRLYAIHYQDPKNSIINLIHNKRNNIVKITEQNEKKQDTITIKHPINKEYNLYKLTDSKTDFFNSDENFKDVNELIAITKLFPLSLDYETSVNLLSEIKESIQEESESDFLTDGI